MQFVALCDVDRTPASLGKRRVEQRYAARGASGARSLALYNDYRELLARPDIDAVVIATPDHWHAIQSIDAALAGKDVYCEKPISMTVQEGRRVVQAVRRYGRIFQTGTQYRSIPTIRQVCGFIRSGGLGEVKSVFTNVDNLASFLRAPRYRPYDPVLNLDKTGDSFVALDFPLPAEPVPEGLDWDLWLGPSPRRSFSTAYHANPSPGVVPWSFCEDFGVTSLTWNLAHAADVIQYALGVEDSGPVEIYHPRSGPYPTLTCRYANGALLHFVNNWQMVKDLYKPVPADARIAGNFGGLFVGERGWLTTMSTGGPIEGGPGKLVEEIGLRVGRS